MSICVKAERGLRPDPVDSSVAGVTQKFSGGAKAGEARGASGKGLHSIASTRESSGSSPYKTGEVAGRTVLQSRGVTPNKPGSVSGAAVGWSTGCVAQVRGKGDL
jgi:hypothetical protein